MINLPSSKREGTEYMKRNRLTTIPTAFTAERYGE